ncbi:GlcNAc-PI de-N-acetylase [Thiospirochaeta perfilievii]|uniref:GlcNAc-PI de-N-acetylase n=1 Tax=Thiospirochaeta perfilievii TaxID=252967 RepID=A0A5C1QAT9_9SPIO|nr:PIG-L family deacetylase [Thiospirochaeta perfilievii]QEN03774.1 GlcNAc-PI de-N-acetylase [Thiospirochaeta perfilievii]
MSNFTLFKRDNNMSLSSKNWKDIFTNWKGESQEHLLFVVPHDDDVIIGGALLIQKAIEDGVKVSVLITTDGSMGYCSEEDRDNIIEIRRNETLKGLEILGVNNAKWLNFPDCNTSNFIGRRVAISGDPCVIDGCTGIENAFTYNLRKIRPTRVFVPAGSDLNMDHKVVYDELLMSIFHATGTIWPNLGEPLGWIPPVYEMAVYCDFDKDPNLKITSDDAALENKLKAILAFESQTQISVLVDSTREGGNVEYFRDIEFNLYDPRRYKDLF